MKLNEILNGIEALEVLGDRQADIAAVTLDSRSVESGSMFFALRGTDSDGHDYIASAVENGASAIVCEELPPWAAAVAIAASPELSPGSGHKMPEELQKTGRGRTTFILVGDSHKAMGLAASAFYGHPSRRLKLVGVTGTNGKTTTATLLYDLFRALGYCVGLISTVDYRVGETIIPSTHTTPDPIRLNAMLAAMVEKGCGYCFMEVSSHAVVQQRIAGLHFTGAAFTNITHDHLDYHGTFAAYLAAKKAFFDALPREAFAVTNIDDRNGKVIVQNTPARTRTISLRSMADYRCKIVEQHLDGMSLSIDEPGGGSGGAEVWVGFIGRFNAYNLLGVYACARELGVEGAEALRILSALRPVSGRFETVRSSGGITAIVDYAHTPDALQNVLDTIAEIRKPGQRLFTVVGCGGDRDNAKRPVMARIAASCSDFTILTSDNPRTEEPAEILAQMKSGLEAAHKAIAIIDRREAILAAVTMASAGDIILVAGKGHETYQIVGTEKLHFDDREEIKNAFLNP